MQPSWQHCPRKTGNNIFQAASVFFSHMNFCLREHNLKCHGCPYMPTQFARGEFWLSGDQGLCGPSKLPSDHFQLFSTSISDKPIQCNPFAFKSPSRDLTERLSSLDSIFAKCASIDLQNSSACSQDFLLENTAYWEVCNRFQ